MAKKERPEPAPVAGEVQKLFDDSADETALAEATVLSVDDLQIVDGKLIADALAMVGGLYEPDVCYNYPKTTAGGRKTWDACDRMKTKCKYKGQTPHIHIVDVGIRGARIAAQAYGGLTYGPLDMPIVTEQAGKFYWVVEVECRDEIRNLTISSWQFQPLLVKGRGGLYDEIEHGGAIVQSKGLRNVILAVLPPQLRRMWVSDYLAGKDAFDPERIAELPGGRKGLTNGGKQRSLPPAEKKKPKAKEKEKPKAKTPKTANSAAADLDQTIAAFADKLGGEDVELVSSWSSMFETPAKAMLTLTRALKDDSEFATYRKQYHEWKEKQPEDSGEEEQAEMDM